MIDRLHVALRRYEQLQPSLRPVSVSTPCPTPLPRQVTVVGAQAVATRISVTLGSELSQWVEINVCPVVEDLLDRSDFRNATRWPLERLPCGAAGEERKLVEALDRDLVDSAKHLTELANQSPLQEKLRQAGPARPARGTGRRRTRARLAPLPAYPLDDLAVVELVSRRPWHDLVNRADYYYPASDLNLVDRSAFLGPDSLRVQVGEFLPLINPRLRTPGDFVTGMLLSRIDYWEGVLRRAAVRCQSALRASRQDGGSRWLATCAALERVAELHGQLRARCVGGNAAKVRDAYIALLQMYIAYRPHVSLDWLELPAELRTWASHSLRYWLESRADSVVAERIATALMDIGPIYRSTIDPELLIAEQCRTHRLVVVAGRGRREVFCNGELVNFDWFANNAVWEFLLVLVEAAKSAQGADAFHLGHKGPTTWKDRRHRLGLLASSLDEWIVSAGKGTYRLTLRPEQICLLEHTDNEFLVEVGAATAGFPW